MVRDSAVSGTSHERTPQRRVCELLAPARALPLLIRGTPKPIVLCPWPRDQRLRVLSAIRRACRPGSLTECTTESKAMRKGNSPMRSISRALVGSVVVCLACISSPAASGGSSPAARELAGVRLGMTMQEASDVLAKHQPPYQLDSPHPSDVVGLQGVSYVAGRRATLYAATSMTVDSVVVYFLDAAVAPTRRRHFAPNDPSSRRPAQRRQRQVFPS